MAEDFPEEQAEVQAAEATVHTRASPDVLFLRIQRWLMENRELGPTDKEQVAEILRGSHMKAEVVLEVMGPHMVRSARRAMGFLGMIEDRLFAPGRLDTMEDDSLIRLLHVMQQRQQQTIEFIQKRSERSAAAWLREVERQAQKEKLGESGMEEESPAKRERMRQVIAKLSLLLEAAKQHEAEVAGSSPDAP